MNVIRAILRPELRPIVNEDNSLILNMNQHIRFAISIDIAELKRHGDQIAALIEQVWAAVNDRLSGVATHKFNDDDMSMQVDGDEVARMGRIIGMTNHG